MSNKYIGAGTSQDQQSLHDWEIYGMDGYDPDSDVNRDVEFLRKEGLSEEKIQAYIRGWNSASQ